MGRIGGALGLRHGIVSSEMAGPKIIDNQTRAVQLARAIASDIQLYNRDKVEKGLRADNLFAALKDEIEEGRELFRGRVTKDMFERNLYDRALVDRLIKSMSAVDLPVW